MKVLFTDMLLSDRIGKLEKKVATLEKQLAPKEKGEQVASQQVPVPIANVGMSCQHKEINEHGVLVERCLRDASFLVMTRAYCMVHVIEARDKEVG